MSWLFSRTDDDNNCECSDCGDGDDEEDVNLTTTTTTTTDAELGDVLLNEPALLHRCFCAWDPIDYLNEETRRSGRREGSGDDCSGYDK